VRFLAFLGAATIAACSSAGEDAAGSSQDFTSTPRPWCPVAEKLEVADSPDDYMAPITVSLESVIDGDTAYFKLTSGTVERIRFMHITAEEVRHDDASPAQNAKATPFGEMTKAHVNDVLAHATKIEIATHRDPNDASKPESDVFGRWLALIWVDGELLQQQLIADGYSGYYTKYGCAQGKLHDALLWSEADANQHNRGVWDPQYKNEHLPVLSQWIGLDQCRPNPLKGQHYCPDFEASVASP
jgi:micrococcal nuclease